MATEKPKPKPKPKPKATTREPAIGEVTAPVVDESTTPEPALVPGTEPEPEAPEGDPRLEVYSKSSRCVYESVMRAPGDRFFLLKEEHYLPKTMEWVIGRAKPQARRFQKYAHPGTFRKAMQTIPKE